MVNAVVNVVVIVAGIVGGGVGIIIGARVNVVHRVVQWVNWSPLKPERSSVLIPSPSIFFEQFLSKKDFYKLSQITPLLPSFNFGMKT